MSEREKSWTVCKTDLLSLPMPTAVVSSWLSAFVQLFRNELKSLNDQHELTVNSGIDYKTTTILLDGRRVKLELW